MYKTAIIGCGKIGTFFDAPDSKKVLTHANAYHKHPQTELKGVMDIHYETARTAGERWECHAYGEAWELLENDCPDIISICTPDEYHYNYLNLVADYNPKAVIVEKPLTKEIGQSEEIVSIYTKKDIPLFVNYSRRYDKTLQAVRESIDNDEFGQILHASAKYTKGILHNGSHAVDIARYLFGPVLSVKPLSAIYDYYDADPTLNAFLTLEKCPNFFLMAGDERCYSIFEFDMVGEKRRVGFDQFGLKYTEYEIRNDPVFNGYKDLERRPSFDTGLGMAMFNLVANVIDCIEGREDIICSGTDALRTQIVCDELLTGYLQGVKNA